MEMLYEQSVASAEEQNADGARTFRARLFSSKPNRRGDILEVQGMDVSRFMENPVVLLEHGRQNQGLPIGRAVALDAQKNSITSRFQFDMDDPVAAIVARKFESGFMSAVSVGYLPQEIEPAQPDGDIWDGIRVVKSELLEFSVVAIPMDSTALRRQAIERLWTPEESSGIITATGAIRAAIQDMRG